MDASDLELLRRYTLEGREEAFTELVRRHLGLVFGVAMRILRNRSLAEDAVQATFVQGDILSRYRVVADGRLEDQPEGHPVILEAVAPVDEDFDTVLRVGHGWLQIAGRAPGTLSGEVRP